MIKNQDFNKLVDTICKNLQYTSLRPVIEKELLHYDILFALSSHGLLDKLTFQGGTCLRLCYNLQRFSEDLDFVGGKNFNWQQLLEIKQVIEDYLGTKYGLEVTIKEPSGKQKKGVVVDRWQVSILTQPQRRNIPKQKIKLEVANVPAYEKKLLAVKHNYDFLPDGYDQLFINVESLNEIFADKIIALAGRNYIKARDLWDLQWLQQKNITIDQKLVNKKIDDYQLQDFSTKLKNRIASIPKFLNSKEFIEEMNRFLDPKVVENTIKKSGFNKYLFEAICECTHNLQ